MQFSPTSSHTIPPLSKYSPQPTVSNALSLCYSLNVREQVSNLYRNTGKITLQVHYIAIPGSKLVKITLGSGKCHINTETFGYFIVELRITWSVSLVYCSVVLWCAWKPNWPELSRPLSSMCFWNIFRMSVLNSLPVVDRRLIRCEFWVLTSIR